MLAHLHLYFPFTEVQYLACSFIRIIHLVFLKTCLTAPVSAERIFKHRFNSLFECHISNTIKYTNIHQNKTYLIPSPFGLTRHYYMQHYSKIIKSLYTQLTNVQSTKSEAEVTVRKKSVSCFTPTCVNTLKTCIFFSRFVLGITVFER